MSYHHNYGAWDRNLYARLHPAVQHSIREVNTRGVEHALMESTMLGYMMGKGYSFHDALRIVEYEYQM
ncbi:MAG: hypothetical protein FWF88_07610 [Peptococcaceae bacterium]|nr:hypothetical protein [Peptococcaceae bacterium]